MEKKSKHDVNKLEEFAFVGDDTGLIKRVKVDIKRSVDVFSVKYRDIPEDFETEIEVKTKKGEVIKKRKLGILTPKDNQKTERFSNEINCKIVKKSGIQARDEGI